MLGRDVGTLSMLVRKADSKEVDVWTRSNDRGDRWYGASVSLDVDQEYVMVLEATMGSGYGGDIAFGNLAKDPLEL